MRHKSVAISGSDLLVRVTRDSDTPWRDVIRWNCRQLDKLEALEERTDAEEAEMEQLETAQRAMVAAKWWRVQWPEHVSVPRYNSDASYAHCESEREACRESDLVYGA